MLLTLGGRWQSLDVNSYNPVTGFRTGSSESGAFSPGIGLVVKPWERLSLYANYIEGLTSPAPPVNAVNATAAFPAFVSRQTEVGAKYDFGAVGVGFAAFEIEQPSGFLDARTLVFSVDGRQRNSGVELTVFGEPAPGIRVLGASACSTACRCVPRILATSVASQWGACRTCSSPLRRVRPAAGLHPRPDGHRPGDLHVGPVLRPSQQPEDPGLGDSRCRPRYATTFQDRR